MNLILDFGNTFLKVALFEDDQIQFFERISITETEIIINRLKSKEFENCIISTVVQLDTEILDFLLKKSINLIEFSSKTPVPITNLYQTPNTLGKDRLGLAVAAYTKYTNENVLVIDAGSCITVDLVNENGEYLGGSIHPGLEMRYKSLNQFTDQLPKIEFDENYFALIGTNTETSIRSGVQTAIIHEIEGTINAYKKDYKSLKIIVCGGNANYLATNLKNSIFADEKFLLHGLNQILLFNV